MTSQDFRYFPQGDYSSVFKDLVSLPTESRTCADLLDGLYSCWSAWSGMKCVQWGDKTPLNTFFLRELYDVFPEAKFLYLQRDIHDVVYSMLKMNRYSSVKASALRWLRANQEWSKFNRQANVNVMTVSYENLVLDPDHEFSKVFEFLGLRFNAEFLTIPPESLPLGDQEYSHFDNVYNSISSSSIGRGKSDLSSDQIRELDDTVLAYGTAHACPIP